MLRGQDTALNRKHKANIKIIT